jgi:hypothetical protein
LSSSFAIWRAVMETNTSLLDLEVACSSAEPKLLSRPSNFKGRKKKKKKKRVRWHYFAIVGYWDHWGQYDWVGTPQF